MTTQPVAQQTHRDPAVKLLIALLVGGAVSVALGVYSNVHDPTGEKPYTLFFSDTIHLKVWFATAVVVLAVVQVLLGARLFDKIHVPRHAPPWLGDAHRLVGTVAFALTLPVAYQCLWGLGFESTDTRVFVHSILGCVFYGAIVTKVLAVRMHGLPERTLPLVGGFVFAVLVGIWLTSSFWFFTSRPAGIPLY
jgi:mitochondrial fission protein ELM1